MRRISEFKKLRVFSILVLMLMIVPPSSQANVIPVFDEYYSSLLEAFQEQDYQRVLEYYEDIVKQWPDITERKDADNFKVYAEAMLSLRAGNNDEAKRGFSSLPAEFPNHEALKDKPSSSVMMYYVQGLLYEEAGRPEDAVDAFQKTGGALDSAVRIVHLQQIIDDSVSVPRPKHLTITATETTPDSIQIEWSDELNRASFKVRCAPYSLNNESIEEHVSEPSVQLSGLLPQTPYAIAISTDDIDLDIISSIISTKSAPQYTSAEFVMQKKMTLQQYSADMAGSSLAEIINKKKNRLPEYEGNRAVIQVYGDYAQMPSSYFLHATFDNLKSAGAKIEYLIILRIEEANIACIKRETIDIQPIRLATLALPLDPLFDQLYVSREGWPEESKGTIELYLNDMLAGVVPFMLLRV